MVKLGDKIRSLRKQAALTQGELAERATLTKGFISQVERDRTSLSVDSLFQILGALDRSPAEFFLDGAETQVVFTRGDRVRVVRPGVSGFELLIPGAQNRRMEPALLHLEPGERTPEEEPHEGDELGFVLRGKVGLRLGRERWPVRRGECFYFKADRTHSIENLGRSPAVFFWVTCPPYF